MAESTAVRDVIATEAAAVPQAHQGVDRRLATFIGVLGAMFLAAMDQTVVGTALPRIVADLNGTNRYSWVVTAYLLTSTIVIAVIGKLSDQLGRKRVFLAGIALFVAASAVCGAAQTMDQLIAFRAVQGLGAGVIMGTAFIVIADIFSPAERGRYTGMMSGIFGLASIVGPLVGGYLTDNVSWRWVFYVNLPIGVIVFTGLWLTFPGHRRPGHPVIDYLGAAVIAAAAALLTLGASLASTDGWGDGRVVVSLAAGALLIVAVPFVEARAREPILPLQLFRSSIYSISVAVSFLLGIAMFGTIIFMPLFLQRVVGVKATNSGVLLTPLMLGMVFASIVGGQVLSRTGRYKYQLMTGFGLMAVGMYLTTQLGVNATQLDVARDMVIFGLGLGTSFPVLAVVGQNAVDHHFVGPATSSMQFIRQIGATLGLAVLGSVVAQDFNTNFARDVSPGLLARIPAACRAALTNSQSLTGGGGGGAAGCALPAHASPAALQSMHQLTEGLRLALTQSLHTAFTYGLLVALVAIGISLFIHEIPLRKTASAQARQKPEAVAESIPL